MRQQQIRRRARRDRPATVEDPATSSPAAGAADRTAELLARIETLLRGSG